MIEKTPAIINKDNMFLFGYLLFVSFFYRIKDSKLTFQGIKVFAVMACICAIIQVCVNIKKKYYCLNTPLIIFGIFCIISVYVFFKNRDTRLPVAIMGIMACVGNTQVLNFFMRWVLLLQSVIVCGVLVLCGGEGFGHKNALALYLMLIMYMALWLTNWEIKSKKNKNIICGVSFIYVITVYMITDCSTALVFNIVALIALVIIENIGKLKNVLITMCTYIYVIMTLVTFLFAFFYYRMAESSLIGEYIIRLNKLFNGRLDLMCYSMKLFGINIIGGNIDFGVIDYTNGGYFHLDSGYMWIMQELGLVVLILFVITFTAMIIKYKDNHIRLFVLSVWSLWGFSEDIFYSVGINFMLLYIAELISKNEKGVQKWTVN